MSNDFICDLCRTRYRNALLRNPDFSCDCDQPKRDYGGDYQPGGLSLVGVNPTFGFEIPDVGRFETNQQLRNWEAANPGKQIISKDSIQEQIHAMEDRREKRMIDQGYQSYEHYRREALDRRSGRGRKLFSMVGRGR